MKATIRHSRAQLMRLREQGNDVPVDDIMRYEQDDMSDEEMVAMFQKLVNSGLAWKLQGSYGRQAKALIDAGLVQLPGGSTKGESMNLARRTFENLAQLDGVIIGVEAGLITDDQLVEFLKGCTEEDFAVIQAELTPDAVKDLGEKTGTGDLSSLLDAKLKDAYESMRRKLVTPGALKATAMQRLTSESRRILVTAVATAKRLREMRQSGDEGKKTAASLQAKLAKRTKSGANLPTK